MRRTASLALLVLAGCAGNSPSSSPLQTGAGTDVGVHFIAHSDDTRLFLCMAPNGDWTPGPWSSEGRTCPAPSRFIQVSRCVSGQTEAREPAEARVTASADHSLVGDQYRGKPICVLPPPF